MCFFSFDPRLHSVDNQYVTLRSQQLILLFCCRFRRDSWPMHSGVLLDRLMETAEVGSEHVYFCISKTTYLELHITKNHPISLFLICSLFVDFLQLIIIADLVEPFRCPIRNHQAASSKLSFPTTLSVELVRWKVREFRREPAEPFFGGGQMTIWNRSHLLKKETFWNIPSSQLPFFCIKKWCVFSLFSGGYCLMVQSGYLGCYRIPPCD